MRLATTTTALLSVIAVFSSSAPIASGSNVDAQGSHQRSPLHHRSMARNVRRTIVGPDGVVNDGGYEHHLEKRFGGRATFYNNEVSEGACGGYSTNDDYIVALNVAQYGNENSVSSWCGKKIQISYGGKTRTATVVDCCPTCPYGGLDMSPGLFESFANKGLGIFQMSWSAAGAGGGNQHHDDDDDDEEEKHTTHTTHHTSTRHTSTSTTHTTHSSTTTSSSSSTSSSSTTSDKPTATPEPISNLRDLTQAMHGMFEMANAVQQ